MLKLLVLNACILSISCVAVLPAEPSCSDLEPPLIPETFSSLVKVTTPRYNAIAYWGRSSFRQAASVLTIFGDGSTNQRQIFYGADNRTLYLNSVGSSIATCAAIPLRDSSNFEYFTWLPQGQGKCQQYTEGAAHFEVWTSIPKSETERIRVVEVNKLDRSKLHKYSEYEPNGDLFYTFEFVTFEGVEPDSSVFQVPAECL